MAEQLQPVDQLHAGVISALHRKGEQRTGALGTDLCHAGIVGRRRQPGIGHGIHARVFFQPGGNLARIGHVPLHPQRQRLDPHQRVMRPLRVHRHPQIAQPDRDGMEGKGHAAQSCMEIQPVIGGFGCGQAGELARGRPVEFARIHHDAAGYRAVAGQVFRRRMHHQCRAMLDGAAQIRGGRGVVDDQRQAHPVGQCGNGIQIGDIAAGVGDGFAEDRAGVLIDRRLDRRQIVEIHELRRPAELADRIAELLDRAAVKLGRRHHIAARLHQREQRHDLRRMAGRTAHCPHAPFQRRHPFCQRRHGRVGQARIDVSNLLQVEQFRGMVRIAEHIGRGLIDRHLPRAGCRIGLCPGMDLQRVESQGSGHGRSLPFVRSAD